MLLQVGPDSGRQQVQVYRAVCQFPGSNAKQGVEGIGFKEVSNEGKVFLYGECRGEYRLAKEGQVVGGIPDMAFGCLEKKGRLTIGKEGQHKRRTNRVIIDYQYFLHIVSNFQSRFEI